jgi:hypothetical protein
MERRLAALRLYGQPSELPPPDWEWVDDQLGAAGTYWLVTSTAGPMW